MDTTSDLAIPAFINTQEVHTRIEVSHRLSIEGYVCLKQIETSYSNPWNQCLFCEECALAHLGIRLRQITHWHTLARDLLGIYPVPCIACQKPLFVRKPATECQECFEAALKATIEGLFLPTRELYHTHSHSFVSFTSEKTPLDLLKGPAQVSTGCSEEQNQQEQNQPGQGPSSSDSRNLTQTISSDSMSNCD